MEFNDLLRTITPTISWTYDKKLDIYGSVEYTKPNGADAIKFDKVYSDIPCRVSVVNLNNTNQQEANQLNHSLKLFCKPDIEIKAGSKIKIDGEKFMTTTTGEPMGYASHQEVYIHRKEWV